MSLASRVLDALTSSSEGLTAAELTHLLFGAAGSRVEALVTQVETLLTRMSSGREIELHADNRYGIPAPAVGIDGPPAPAIAEQPQHSSVVDDAAGESKASGDHPSVPVSALAIMTGGTRNGRIRLLAVAVVRLEDDREVMMWSSLVNPDPETGRRIRLPRTLLKKAGMEDEAFEDAPPVGAVLAELGSVIAGTTVVGHDVATTLDTLRAIARWHSVPSPYVRGMAWVDTEAVAREVLPTLARPSLDRVAQALGVAPVRHDRADLRARQVAAVFLALSVRQATTGAERPRPALGGGPQRGNLVTYGTLLASQMPMAPGVYSFYDATNTLLYIGKARNLRARVTQHFTGVGGSARGDALLARVASITHVVTDCELDAVLLERERIETDRPPYNVQTKTHQGSAYLVLDLAAPYPRIGGVGKRDPVDGSEVFGPYRTIADARQIAGAVVRLFGVRPCTRRLPTKVPALRVPCLLYGQGICPAPCAPYVTTERYATAVSYARHWLHYGRDATIDKIDAAVRARDSSVSGHEPTSDGRRAERQWLLATRTRLLRARIDIPDVRHRPDVARDTAVIVAYPGTIREGETGSMVVAYRLWNGRVTDRQVWRHGTTGWVADRAMPLALDWARDAVIMRGLYHHHGHAQIRAFASPMETPEEIRAWLESLDFTADPISDGREQADDSTDWEI